MAEDKRVVANGQRLHEGDIVPEEWVGNEKQVLTRLYLVCDTKEELAAAIKEYHEKVKVFDKAGNNMLLKGFDVDNALATSSDYVPQVNKKETTEVVHS